MTLRSQGSGAIPLPHLIRLGTAGALATPPGDAPPEQPAPCSGPMCSGNPASPLSTIPPVPDRSGEEWAICMIAVDSPGPAHFAHLPGDPEFQPLNDPTFIFHPPRAGFASAHPLSTPIRQRWIARSEPSPRTVRDGHARHAREIDPGSALIQGPLSIAEPDRIKRCATRHHGGGIVASLRPPADWPFIASSSFVHRFHCGSPFHLAKELPCVLIVLVARSR